MDKQNVRALECYSAKKEQNSDTYYDMDEPWGLHAKWTKPDIKR